MANVIPSGKPNCFEYSVFSGSGSNYVAIKIYDLSSGTASLVTTVGMTHVFNGTYWAAYTFPNSSAGKNFLIQKSVYTDGTFATVDSSYAPGSEIVEIDGFDNNSGKVA